MNDDALATLLAQFEAQEQAAAAPEQHELLTAVTVMVVGVATESHDGLPAWQLLGSHDWVMV